MADGYIALEPHQFIFGKYVRDQAHIGMYIDLPALGGSDAGTFLPAVLKGVKGKESYTGYIYSGGIDTENAAAFVQIMHRITRGLYGFYSATVKVLNLPQEIRAG